MPCFEYSGWSGRRKGKVGRYRADRPSLLSQSLFARAAYRPASVPTQWFVLLRGRAKGGDRLVSRKADEVAFDQSSCAFSLFSWNAPQRSFCGFFHKQQTTGKGLHQGFRRDAIHRVRMMVRIFCQRKCGCGVPLQKPPKRRLRGLSVSVINRGAWPSDGGRCGAGGGRRGCPARRNGRGRASGYPGSRGSGESARRGRGNRDSFLG